VKALGGPSSKVYVPCKPNEQPDYDEVVVFSKDQILPRYLIYYKIGDASSPSASPSPQDKRTPSSPINMSLDIRDASGKKNVVSLV
jgi:hypothetical protein